ncbi:MAG TPA: UDP-glucuronic acid decarboxylase family protein [Hansschlegelia sp.]|nr:UDP-glucuronic acid decarboxylase family protein [Hansschlegelia sp.]HVI27451.1 UDP-glucuronic acid decarboxylase family protein [Hansschlegelia sp.]
MSEMRSGGKTAVVAGGAGFLGSHLCDRLIADGARVICIDNLLTGRIENLRQFEREPRFTLIEADVIDPLPQRIASGRDRIDEIYNLACAASPPHYQADPEHTMLTSVIGTHQLLGLAAGKGARFMLASTSEVYGDPDVHPQPETYRGNVNPIGPRACYDEGKRAAECLASDALRARRVDARIARIFNTYGPRMQPDDGRVVSNVICQALSGRDITVYGSGEQTRSFCYVSDLVEGFIRLMACDKDLPGPINLGNPQELTVNELVRLVLAHLGADCVVVTKPLPVDDPRRRRPDISRAKSYLGWAPQVTLEAGLAETCAYFAERAAEFRQRPAEAVVNGADAVEAGLL